MPIVFRVKGVGRTRENLRRASRIPSAMERGARTWGTKLERNVRRSAKTAGIKPFGGRLLSKGGIRFEWQPKKKEGQLFVIMHGVYQDNEGINERKWVTVKRSRTQLYNWALQSPHSPQGIKKKAQALAMGRIRRFSIKIRTHPFIGRGVKQSLRELPTYLRAEVRKA